MTASLTLPLISCFHGLGWYSWAENERRESEDMAAAAVRATAGSSADREKAVELAAVREREGGKAQRGGSPGLALADDEEGAEEEAKSGFDFVVSPSQRGEETKKAATGDKTGSIYNDNGDNNNNNNNNNNESSSSRSMSTNNTDIDMKVEGGADWEDDETGTDDIRLALAGEHVVAGRSAAAAAAATDYARAMSVAEGVDAGRDICESRVAAGSKHQ